MKIRTVVIAVVAAVCFGFLTEATHGQGPLPNNLFAQYTTQGNANLSNAGMYPAPHWVPRQMGHTYYTYQPLMPHEMMYAHSRNYYNYYAPADRFYANKYGHHRGGAGLTKTQVVWQNGCSHMAPLPGNMRPFAAIHYKLAAHKYGLNSGGKAGGHGGLGHLRGKFGCSTCGSTTCDGSCDTGCDAGCGGEVYGGEVYGGEVYGGEVINAPAGGCASGGCSVNLSDGIVN